VLEVGAFLVGVSREQSYSPGLLTVRVCVACVCVRKSRVSCMRGACVETSCG
jgi:hypothetical protein